MTSPILEWPPISLNPRVSRWRRPRLSLTGRIIRMFLLIIPQRWKTHMYDAFAKAGPPFSTHVPSMRTIFRLPFGLVLKIVPGGGTVEADALRFVSRLHGVHTPYLIDSATSPTKSYLLTTWVEGQSVGAIWDRLSAFEREGIVSDMGDQLRAMRRQTMSASTHLICNASFGPVDDPRIPWVARDNPRTFSSCKAFAEEVWTGLDWDRNRNTLKPVLEPLIERQDVPVVFSHGDLLPKNLILPGGLDCWRSGSSRICLIDWEYAGWMPLYWDALKMTWMECEQDDEWLHMGRAIFPECETELNADWEWRSRSGVLIL
ncbi:protein kinase subdomain-containing protein PKL [Lyophyllum atratum]|nr:protein kinase subdomain-containing protein PKL [Lyophyllum atratum]